MSEIEPLKPHRLKPEDILIKSYLYELKCMGLESDEQIEVYLKEELIAKGIIYE